MDYLQILEIEQSAYPEEFQMMQDCESMKDIADYCECSLSKLIVLGVPGRWYALVARHKKGTAEFVDIAKIPGEGMIPWPEVLGALRSTGIKRISADLRDKTSYKVLKRFGTQFGVTVEREREYYDSCFGETMHEVVLSL